MTGCRPHNEAANDEKYIDTKRTNLRNGRRSFFGSHSYGVIKNDQHRGEGPQILDGQYGGVRLCH
jgi:hypothetical protein